MTGKYQNASSAAAENLGFQNVFANLRAPRFVASYHKEPDWVDWARRTIASISRIWGAAGGVILPTTSEGSADERLLRFIRAYDPDYITYHQPTLRDMAERTPEAIERISERYGLNDRSDTQAWEQVFGQPIAMPELNGLAEQINSWCSPYKGVDPNERQFSSGEIHPLPREAYWSNDLTLLPTLPGERIIELDLTGIDSVLALMLETRVGALDSKSVDGLNRVTLPVEQEDIRHIVHLAITGEVPAHWNLHDRYLAAINAAATGNSPSALTGQEFLANTPFARTTRSLVRVGNAVARSRSVVCVVGDTAEDHALAMLCDRFLGHGAWVPASLLADATLAPMISTSMYFTRFPYAQGQTRFLVTSLSETFDTLRELVPNLNGHDSTDNDSEFISHYRRLTWVDPGKMDLSAEFNFLADPKSFSVARTLPVRRHEEGVSLLTPLETPLPEVVQQVTTESQWQVDVIMPSMLPPARSELSSRLLQSTPEGVIPETIARASRYGISYSSANMGLVLAGTPLEGRLARPLLNFPSGEQIFKQLVEAQGGGAAPSEAGRRAYNVISLWGDFEATVTDLEGSARALLDAFMPPGKPKTGDYVDGYQIRGKGYLNFAHAASAIEGDDNQARQVLDRLLSSGVLRRGLLLSCERCRWQDFYPIEQVASNFTCSACNHASRLTSDRWYKGDMEPAWNYSLDQVVRDLLQKHGDLPLLAAHHLRGTSRNYLWAPELLVEFSSKEKIELDICLVVDGEIIVGEAKSNGQLKQTGVSNEAAAKRLVRAARKLKADKVVLATSESNWAPGAVEAMKAAVRELPSKDPDLELVVLEQIGT